MKLDELDLSVNTRAILFDQELRIGQVALRGLAMTLISDPNAVDGPEPLDPDATEDNRPPIQKMSETLSELWASLPGFLELEEFVFEDANVRITPPKGVAGQQVDLKLQGAVRFIYRMNPATQGLAGVLSIADEPWAVDHEVFQKEGHLAELREEIGEKSGASFRFHKVEFQKRELFFPKSLSRSFCCCVIIG